MIKYPLLLAHSGYCMLIGWYAEETVVLQTGLISAQQVEQHINDRICHRTTQVSEPEPHPEHAVVGVPGEAKRVAKGSDDRG